MVTREQTILAEISKYAKLVVLRQRKTTELCQNGKSLSGVMNCIKDLNRTI